MSVEIKYFSLLCLIKAVHSKRKMPNAQKEPKSIELAYCLNLNALALSYFFYLFFIYFFVTKEVIQSLVPHPCHCRKFYEYIEPADTINEDENSSSIISHVKLSFLSVAKFYKTLHFIIKDIVAQFLDLDIFSPVHRLLRILYLNSGNGFQIVDLGISQHLAGLWDFFRRYTKRRAYKDN